jgi:phage gp29-like protein
VTAAIAASRHLRRPTLLDEHGRPIYEPEVRKLAAAPNPRGMQTYSSHPEIGLTVESLLSNHRLAEGGAPTRMMDMWDGLVQRHADVRGMLNERNEDVAGADFAIVTPPDRNDKPSQMAAAALQEYLQYSVSTYAGSLSDAPSSCSGRSPRTTSATATSRG